MDKALQGSPSEPIIIRVPKLGWPRVRTWKELRQAGLGRHLSTDAKARSVDQDQGLVARAARYANRTALEGGHPHFVDPAAPTLNQRAFQQQRKELLKLIWKAVMRVERSAPGGIFWFGVTVVSPDHLVTANLITAERLEKIRRWHGRRFRKLQGGVMEVGFIDISRNEDRDGKGLHSVHEHTLVGVHAVTEAGARAAVKQAYAVSNPIGTVQKPLWIKQTTVRGLIEAREHAIGWLEYATRSSKIGLIMRRESFTGRDGKQRTVDRGLTVKQLAEVLPRLGRLSFNERVIVAGARKVRGRLQVRWLVDREAAASTARPRAGSEPIQTTVRG